MVSASNAFPSSQAFRELPLLTLYLTERCNSRCISCDYWRTGQRDLSLESVREMLPDLSGFGTQLVLISGGEPLLNPHWPQIAALLRSRGMTLWLLTSGLALAKHAARAAALFHSITVSLDGASQETYSAIRGLDAFNRVCEGIARVAHVVPTGVRVTVQRGNYQELPQLVDLAKRLGAARISFLAADVRGTAAFGRTGRPDHPIALSESDLPVFQRALEDLSASHAADFASGFIAESPRKLSHLLDYFAALCGRGNFPPVRCNAPEFSAVFEASGNVRPCFFIPGPESSGRPPGLADALNSGKMAALRAEIRAGQRPECRSCVCSMWQEPGEPVRFSPPRSRQ